MKLSEAPTVHPTASVERATLGRWTEVGARCRLLECEFGDYSYIVDDGQITFATVGKFANIASNVRLHPTNHPMWRPTLHHFTYRSNDYFEDAERDERVFDWRRSQWVTVGHDVWIGHAATVMPSVTVGNGAIIGAGAVVTRDVDPFTIVAGVPARPVRCRFTAELAEAMERIAWWDWDHATLRARLGDFRDLTPEAFADKYRP